MPGFDKNEFWLKIVSMYPDAKENNYLLRLNSEQIKELKKEIRYVSNASLLENENRKKIVDKIVEAFAEELDKVKKGTEKALVSTRKVTNYTRHEIQINEEDIKREKEKYGEDVFNNQSDDSTVRTIR